MRRLFTAPKGDRGSIGSAVVFSLFAAMVLVTVASTVISTMNLTRGIADRGSAGAEAIILQENLIRSGTTDGEHCFARTCVDGTFSTADGRASVSVTGPEGFSRTRTFSEVTGVMISGFDAAGNPVWSSAADTSLRAFASVAVSAGHACALESSGAAWCWGENSRGQLGTGTGTESSADPVQVAGSHRFTTLALSVAGTCALDESGAAWCWGAGDHGRNGHGSTSDAATPVRAGTGTYTSLTVSETTSCALSGTTLDCWGLNAGTGAPDGSRTPVEVDGAYSTVVMDAQRACALDTGGKAWCWSASPGTVIGTGGAGSSADPAAVNGSRTYTKLAAGGGVFCGITGAGDAWCFGPNHAGQLGDGTTTDADIPVKVSGGLRFESLALSAGTSCGLSSGTVWCWGEGSDGQLGDGGTAPADEPVRAAVSGSASSVTAGGSGWFCARAAASVQCWGTNSSGQASPGTSSSTGTPVPVPSVDAAQVMTSGSSACALETSGTVKCWGQLAGSPSAPAGVGRTEVAPGTFTGYVRSHQ